MPFLNSFLHQVVQKKGGPPLQRMSKRVEESHKQSCTKTVFK